LFAAFDRELVEFFRFDPVQIGKYIGSNPTKTGAIVVNSAFTAVGVVVNTPAVGPDHAEILL
jgi:hypothetical protein